MPHGDERPRRAAGVEGEAELGEDDDRALPGAGASRQAQLPPGGGEPELNHAPRDTRRPPPCQPWGATLVDAGMASVVAERTMEHDGELELIEAARDGDREAAAALLTRYELVAHRTCRHLLPPDADPESAAQEVLLRALRSLAKFNAQGSFAGWLATIAMNLCRDRLRRRRLVPFVPLETEGDDEKGGLLAVLAEPSPDPERVAMAREAVDRVRREVGALPMRQREVFTLRFYVGLHLEGIAQALGVDVGTVKTHLHRAIRRVRAATVEAVP
jgi:RNA polymerase sigma-70 factor, ECF subfamily